MWAALLSWSGLSILFKAHALLVTVAPNATHSSQKPDSALIHVGSERNASNVTDTNQSGLKARTRRAAKAKSRHTQPKVGGESIPLEELTTSMMVRPCYHENCAHWLDTEGHRIEAHGAGVVQSPLDKRWYWYGETEKRDARAQEPKHLVNHSSSQIRHGVNCYSSDSLAGPWKKEGRVFSQSQIHIPEEKGPFIIERPKVLYNAKTDKFVMWFHVDLDTYKFRHVGVAIADNASGPFRFKHTIQPDGLPSLDMSVYLDTDGKAYFVRSVNNQYFAISGLADDFLNTTGIQSIGDGKVFGNWMVEGFALFRHPYPKGPLYMIASHCDYWNPNPLALFRSDGPNMSDPQWVNLGNPTKRFNSFNSQPNFVVSYTTPSNMSYPVYMGDNWLHAGPRGLSDASYVWLPLRFDNQNEAILEDFGAWSLDDPFSQPSGAMSVLGKTVRPSRKRASL